MPQIQSGILRSQYRRQSTRRGDEHIHRIGLQQTNLIPYVGRMRPGGGGNERVETPRRRFQTFA
eukprot:CAMPEP_0184435180 /NCGR_PEP_ID=MMETSP0738-20130409/478615_1 /TAXON_ID=385413 /ORGANISM="Thalassiosira miniscula, Strain CCMP1093" /LENGTH=63 /DNA_ID=CAMNT_0026801469 /DNA_START=24 /DNA_END=212 /DNA_ORIENTATION=-